MAENSKIEWTHHTFNPWIGCQKVGPGCDHCYAEAWDARGLQQRESRWGPHADRTRTSAGNWSKPRAWNKAAAGLAERPRVFCASLADVFDNHGSILPEWRADLWALIRATPNLDWLLLTKRPGNIAKMLPPDWGAGYPNVWLGCTVVNQDEADRDIPKLLAVPARVRFLSMEPLLGPVDLRAYMPGCYECGGGCGSRLPHHPGVDRCVKCEAEYGQDHDAFEFCPDCGEAEWDAVCPDCGHYMVYQHPDTSNLDLVIVGGESGPGARAMHPDWVLSMRDQCQAAGVAFFFKQWGEFRPPVTEDDHRAVRDGKAFGGSLLPDGGFGNPYGSAVVRVGKKAAGRLLDGRTWDQLPGAK